MQRHDDEVEGKAVWQRMHLWIKRHDTRQRGVEPEGNKDLGFLISATIPLPVR